VCVATRELVVFGMPQALSVLNGKTENVDENYLQSSWNSSVELIRSESKLIREILFIMTPTIYVNDESSSKRCIKRKISSSLEVNQSMEIEIKKQDNGELN